MPRPSPAFIAILVALLSLVSSASAVNIFTAPNGELSAPFALPVGPPELTSAPLLLPLARPGCPTALAAKGATNSGSFGPRAAPVAGVDYSY